MKFLMKLKLKDCDEVFAEGFEPGVVVMQELDFRTATQEDRLKPMFLKAMMDHEREFIEAHIEVEWVEL